MRLVKSKPRHDAKEFAVGKHVGVGCHLAHCNCDILTELAVQDARRVVFRAGLEVLLKVLLLGLARVWRVFRRSKRTLAISSELLLTLDATQRILVENAAAVAPVWLLLLLALSEDALIFCATLTSNKPFSCF